jgi:hypothetical protein
MSLHKANKSGKEHRIEYGTKGQPYCKAVDSSCRNHGDCLWCYNTRTYKNRAMDKIYKKEIKKFRGTIENLEDRELL